MPLRPILFLLTVFFFGLFCLTDDGGDDDDDDGVYLGSDSDLSLKILEDKKTPGAVLSASVHSSVNDNQPFLLASPGPKPAPTYEMVNTRMTWMIEDKPKKDCIHNFSI